MLQNHERSPWYAESTTVCPKKPPAIGDNVNPSESPPRITLRERFLPFLPPPAVLVFRAVSATKDAASSDSLTPFNFSRILFFVSGDTLPALFIKSLSFVVPSS